MDGARIAAYASRSVTGTRRSANQDRHFVDTELGLVLLADGVAGRRAGHRAAELAISAASAQIGLAAQAKKLAMPQAAVVVEDAFHCAHVAVCLAAALDTQLTAMATTLVGALFVDAYVVIGNLGDSRAYRVRRACAEQLTRDHLVHHEGLSDLSADDARALRPLLQLLTRAAGHKKEAVPELSVEPLLPGDLFVFCSNGLSPALEIPSVWESFDRQASLEERCDALFKRAGPTEDDATVVIVQPSPVLTTGLS
jgi:serine/threonine protein phosphatase PrpC